MTAATAATPSPTPYRAKLFMSKGDSYFTIVTCPRCRVDFRLRWPVTLLNYPEHSNLHLKCPRCQDSFTSNQLPTGKMRHIAGGCEDYPAAPVESIEPTKNP
jgi:phage FluMu protein Com